MKPGDKNFDWFVWLRQAVEKDPPMEQWRIAQMLAKSWVTCACGQLCSKLPRHNNGEPIDYELGDLGAAFSTDINCADYKHALVILQEIEKRTTELLKQSGLGQ